MDLKSGMGRRKDLWKTFHVLQRLDASIWVGRSDLWEANHPELIDQMSRRFEEELMRHNLNVDITMLKQGRNSWEWYLTNLFLYSESAVAYMSTAALELALLCVQFDFHPEDVFSNDWLCVSKKETLLDQIGPKIYYTHPVYISHLWVENVAARRIFFVRRLQALVNALGFVPSKCRVLDVGCGMAGSLRLLQGYQERIGIDISEPIVHWCNQMRNGDERYEVMDCRAIRYSNESFDLVLCFDVLEHVDKPRETLMEIHRVIRRPGIVVIVYPFGSHDWDSHISLVEKPVFDSWLESIGYVVIAELIPPGEVFPCSVCYFLRAASREFELLRYSATDTTDDK